MSDPARPADPAEALTAVLRPCIQGPTTRPHERRAMAQVGWLGHRAGDVYALNDPPMDGREPGGYSPLYIQVGTWEDLGDGKWGIRD